MKINLVCEGGGVRGIAHIGALCALEDYGFTFNSFAGTSVGALITSLMAVGYSAYEIKKILFDLDFSLYINKTILASIPVLGKKLSLFKSKGIFSTTAIEELLTKLYSVKGKKYFKDINKDINYIRFIATDITQKQILILPEDLKKYNIDPLNFEIAKAVKMSISLPLIFIPEKIKTPKGSCYILDGGLISNLPIWLFNSNTKYPTFALKLVSNQDKNVTYAEKCSLNKYLMDIIDACMAKNESIYFSSLNNIHTLELPTFDIAVTDFYISYSNKEKLFNSGYNTMTNFLKKNNICSNINHLN